jgi:hypothetical protein
MVYFIGKSQLIHAKQFALRLQVLADLAELRQAGCR